jgi:hypothetical protein
MVENGNGQHKEILWNTLSFVSVKHIYLPRYLIRMTRKFEKWLSFVLKVLILSILLDRRKCHWTCSARREEKAGREH